MIFSQSQSLKKQKAMKFSNSIKQNLSLINDNLCQQLSKYKVSQDQELAFLNESEASIPNYQSQKQISQTLIILRQLLQLWQQNPSKSILLYNRIIQRSISIPNQNPSILYPILSNTLFQNNIWPLMTYYLQNQLKFSTLQNQSPKIVHVWYNFIVCEKNALFSKILSENKSECEDIGKWFKTYCLQQLFLSFYKNQKKLYTIFIKDFFLYGLAFLFFQSIKVLQKKYHLSYNFPQNIDKSQKQSQILHIQTNYIKKFNLTFP